MCISQIGIFCVHQSDRLDIVMCIIQIGIAMSIIHLGIFYVHQSDRYCCEHHSFRYFLCASVR